MEELRVRKDDSSESTLSAVKELVPLAIDVLRKALEKGDTKIALEIAKLSGAFHAAKREFEAEKGPSFEEIMAELARRSEEETWEKT
jgi:hypothetical protein